MDMFDSTSVSKGLIKLNQIVSSILPSVLLKIIISISRIEKIKTPLKKPPGRLGKYILSSGSGEDS